MSPFEKIISKVMPLDRVNVDTDAIIPKQFLKSIRRTGFGPHLFDEWRYLDRGEPEMDCSGRPKNKDFVLNNPGYSGSRILLTRENFGCGSSREHAAWALVDYGFRVLIGPGFADIFYNNCFKNGLLPIKLASHTIDLLFEECSETYQLTVDLATQKIVKISGECIGFDIDESRKHRLLNGLDDIALTLEQTHKIRAYEARRRQQTPWLFGS